MIPGSVSVLIIMLAVSVTGVKVEEEIQSCGTFRTTSSLVLLGSPVTANCSFLDNCLTPDFPSPDIEWRLGKTLLPGRMVAAEGGKVSEIVIPSFNWTMKSITCYIQTSPVQMIGGTLIRAGYPPSPPQNLSCQTNLTTSNTLTCRWSSGREETHLPTTYTLHTEIRSQNVSYTYHPPQGTHRYTIPRAHFIYFVEMDIYVTAANDLGRETSARLTLEPISAAKFDQPNILSIQPKPKKPGCLRLRWGLSPHQAWMKRNLMTLEVRMKTADNGRWTEQPTRVNDTKLAFSIDRCHLLHGTRYFAQIRIRYKQSPWSEWSASRSGDTLESAPTGLLDYWMRVSGAQHQRIAHLFWKPSRQFHANGRNLSYVVSLQKAPSRGGQVCATVGKHCIFQFQQGLEKVYLSAFNAAGKSPPTEVTIYRTQQRRAVLSATADPQGEESLRVRWKSRTLVFPTLTGFVVQWRPLLKTDPSLIMFQLVDRNVSDVVITGNFEPYKPYEISVYPRFKDGIGPPQTVNAYLRQKAPSQVPTLMIRKNWWMGVELTWNEIPLDQRNGIIKNYKVFYQDKTKRIQHEVDANLERKVVLRNLKTKGPYEAFLMVSTLSGSRNGSSTHFDAEPFDVLAVVLIVMVSGFGLSLFIIFFMTCFSNHKWLKVHFWPVVPDPAHSSIKRWTSGLIQDTKCHQDTDEPNPIYLSHLSFLDLPMKVADKDKDPWLSCPDDTSDLGESICGSPFVPSYSGSNSDSVPYATVIFPSPSTSPPARDSHVYLRSESTQPLLDSEEVFDLQCKQIVSSGPRQAQRCFFSSCHDHEPEDSVEPDIHWDDFPFLRALAMNDN